MSFSIITEYPGWFIIFCLLVGALYAFILYYRERSSAFTSLHKKLMMSFRFVAVSLLCFLLLGPMFRTVTREVEKPVVILAIDNSQSVIALKDSTARKQAVEAMRKKISEGLTGKYELHEFTFGSKVSEGGALSFDEKQTDFTMLFDELNVRFVNRNVGALLIASDGIYNSGSSPVSGPTRIKAPVFAVALGDTSEYRDVILSRVNHNRTAFLGNSFPLEVLVDARQASGAQVILTVAEDESVLFTRNLTIAGNRFHTRIPVFLDAKSRGLKHYRVTLSSVSGEATLANNSKDIYIEVIDSKQKVLLVAAAAHPDLSALRNAIESSPNYEVTLKYATEFDGNATGYNVVITHGLPTIAGTSEWIKRWIAGGQSLWLILSASVNVNSLNALQTGISISGNNGTVNDVQGVMEQDFSLFSVSDELRNAVPLWPPLVNPFGIYKLSAAGYSLVSQRIGTVSTGQPLLAFIQADESRIAVLCGEGLWRWRLAEYEKNTGHALYNELVEKTVQYLSAAANKSPFRIQHKNTYLENEPVVFDAELLNESGVLTNTPEVRMTLTTEGEKQYTFTFSRNEKTYTLNAGLLPVGRYRYRAEAKLSGKLMTHSGEINVIPLQVETTNTIADHQLLYAMAERNGGAMFHVGEEDKLLQSLRNREDIASVSYQHKKLRDLVESPWVFVIIILLISMEWFLRKRAGSY